MTRVLTTFLLDLIESGYTGEDLVLIIRTVISDYIEADIDKNFLSNLLSPWIEIYSTQEFQKTDSREFILKNTISQYFDDTIENYAIIKNHLLELSMYDKVIERESNKYFFLIDLLLQNYALHFKALKAFDEIKQQKDVDVSGVALSTSTTSKAIISKQYNSVKTLLKSMPDNKELMFRKKVYSEYLRNPLSANTMFHIVNLMGNIKSLTEEENNYIRNSRKVINSAFPIEKKDIYKSANILITIFFNKNSFWIKTLNTKKIISANKLIDINEVLMQNLFEVKNTLNKSNIKKAIQIKTNFDDTPLYEFQSGKNKKIHPSFEETEENIQLWNDITEYIKGKIPLKQSR